MKILKQKEGINLPEVVTSEMTLSSNFDHIIGMLIDAYGDPLLAALREPIANAIDANREVGNNLPAILKITKNPEDFYVEIKDSGKGISPQRFHDIFMVVGNSTKNSSNKEIGGFGIGSLAPLSYDKQFIITTVHDGVLYFYNISRDGDKVKSFLLKEEKTDLDNGTTIKFFIKKDDLHLLLNKVRRISSTMKDLIVEFPKYDIEDIRNSNVIHHYDDDGEQLFLTSSLDKGYIIEMGGLNYKISYTSELPTDVTPSFPIGSLIISKDRESIIENNQNKKVIEDKVRKILSYLKNIEKKSKKETLSSINKGNFLDKVERGWFYTQVIIDDNYNYKSRLQSPIKINSLIFTEKNLYNSFRVKTTFRIPSYYKLGNGLRKITSSIKGLSDELLFLENPNPNLKSYYRSIINYTDVLREKPGFKFKFIKDLLNLEKGGYFSRDAILLYYYYYKNKYNNLNLINEIPKDFIKKKKRSSRFKYYFKVVTSNGPSITLGIDEPDDFVFSKNSKTIYFIKNKIDYNKIKILLGTYQLIEIKEKNKEMFDNIYEKNRDRIIPLEKLSFKDERILRKKITSSYIVKLLEKEGLETKSWFYKDPHIIKFMRDITSNSLREFDPFINQLIRKYLFEDNMDYSILSDFKNLYDDIVLSNKINPLPVDKLRERLKTFLKIKRMKNDSI